MKKLCLLAFALLLCFPVYGRGAKRPKELNVLFIGNSFTSGLPGVVAMLAKANNRSLTFKSVVRGSWTLKMHSESKQTLAAIREGGWDFVVLQDQSQIPSFAESQRARDMYPYVTKLHNEIKKSGAKTLLYLTWSDPTGDHSNNPDDTFDKMQKRLQEGYEKAAKLCSASVVPVGLAWAKVRKEKKSLNLYSDDDHHANMKGLYLNACVFFRYLFQTKVRAGLELPAGELSKAETRSLHNVANTLSYKLPGN